jgi:hypothetical protein
MSLVQVSSSQERLQDKGQFKSVFNKGYSFSNYFNGLMDIPPDSEIALHSASFRVREINNFDFTGVSDSGGDYNMRMLYAPTRDSYVEESNSDTYNPTHNPLLHYVPRKAYNTIVDVWSDLVSALNLSAIPSLQRAFTTTNSVIGNKTRIDLTATPNAGNSAITAIPADGFVGNGSIIDGSTIQKTSTGSSTDNSSIFYSNTNGIHNLGRIDYDLFTTETEGQIRWAKHTFACGVKRAYQPSWDLMRSYETEGLDSMDDPKIISQRFTLQNLFIKGALNPNYIGEYAFVVRAKYDGQGGSPTLLPCIDILKYEVVNGMSAYLTIATGSTSTNTKSGTAIPYSPQLDPASATWKNAVVDGGMGLGENVIFGATLGLTMKFAGNKVSFFVLNGATEYQVQISPISTTETAYLTNLEDALSDVVFPLQAYSLLTGNADTMNIQYTPARTQEVLGNFGDTRDNYELYLANNKIIPSGLYNQNALQNSPLSFFDYTIVGAGNTAQIVLVPYPYDTIGGTGNNYITNVLSLGFGDNVSTNMKIQAPLQGVLNPNVEQRLGSATSVFLLTLTGDVLGGNYTPSTIATTPFLKGIYIRLRNLGNRSTFGSINSADSDKLISVINKYDYTEKQEGEEFPIYNYNENEKLYVSLNNPSLIQTNKLDFQLVDGFGVEVLDIAECMLVLHIRPCPYGQYFKSAYT